MALSDEDCWHGSANALADRIDTAVTELRDLLGFADDILQSEQMPKPWDKWDAAVSAGQDAWLELAECGDVSEGARIVCKALRRCTISEWPPQ